MSHTSVVTDSVFTDEKIMEKAVATLNAQGHNLQWVKGGVPRMYYADQFLKFTNGKEADFTLKIAGCAYDIGFIRKNGKLEPVLDDYANHIAKHLGMLEAPEFDRKNKSHHIRKLRAFYEIEILKATAIKRSMRVGPLAQNKATGQFTLTVSR